MKAIIAFFFVAILIFVLLLPLREASQAALADQAFQINWFTLDGGGGENAAGIYSLKGTVGQPDAESTQGGDFTLAGGFWVAGILDFLDHLIHLPLIIR